MISRVGSVRCVALVIALLVGVGCGGDDDATPTAPATATPTTAPTATATPEPCPIDTPGSGDDLFGARIASDEEFAAYAKCLPPPSATPLPAQFVIPPSDLPPPQAQGTAEHLGFPGSCETWSGGYAMGSYTANLTNQRSLGDLANAISPGFLYPYVLNQEGGSCGGDTMVGSTLSYLVANTAPSLLDVPYSPSCTCLDQVDIDQSYDTDLSIGSWCALPEADSATILAWVKGYLAQGRVVQISIVMPWGLPEYTGGVFDVPTSCPTPAPTPTMPACAPYGDDATCIASATTQSGCAQHGVAVVGYDDDLVGPDGQSGALRILNSFGGTWGESGYMWMSYGTFQAIYLAGTLATAPPAGDASMLRSVKQLLEPRSDAPARVHLVVDAALARPVTAVNLTVTDPSGVTVTHRLLQPFRSGTLYLTRDDGNQFQSGMWTVEVTGTTADGATPLIAGTVPVMPAPDSTLAAAPLPDALNGADGRSADRQALRSGVLINNR